jgi:EpsI family protein
MVTRRTLLLSGAIAGAALAARAMRPSLKADQAAPPLEGLIPKQVDTWRAVQTARVPVSMYTSRDQPYDDQIARTYVDDQRHELMLAVAYGAHQRQEVKIHRPELCYPAQGWQVVQLQRASFDLGQREGPPVIGHRMVVTTGTVDEAVSYWIRIGSTYSDSPWRTRWVIIQEGLAGHMTDGVLVRFSERLAHGAAPDEAFARQAAFARSLFAQLSPEGRTLLAR